MIVIDGKDPTPKYYQLKKYLASQIESRELRVGDQLPSEDELARQCKVSRNTVRGALDHLAQEGYIERSHGRGTFVTSDRSRAAVSTWMVIVPDICYPLYPELIRGLEDVARQHGVSLILGNTDNEPEQQAAYVERAIRQRPAGVAISPVLFGQPHAEALNALVKSGIPLVFVTRGVAGVEAPRVVCQNRHGSYLAVKHLISLGHRKIAYVSWPRYSVTVDRHAGYLDALREHGLPERPEYIRFAPDPDTADPKWPDRSEAYVCSSALELLDLPDPPTALVIPRDVSAFLVYKAVEETGRTVPDDVSIVGYDGLPSPDFVRGRLTSVAYPKHESGLEAGKLLVALSQGQDVRQRIELPSTLIKGNTARAAEMRSEPQSTKLGRRPRAAEARA